MNTVTPHLPGLFGRRPVAEVPRFNPRSWWKTPFRIVQTNLRLIDVQQDPRDIAKAVSAFGANALVSNIGGIVAFYQTALDLHWKNPFLRSEFASEMLEAARGEGLAYIGRFDLTKGTQCAFDAHPEWFIVDRDHRPLMFEGTFQACPNGGWADGYGHEILREGLLRHDLDGVFFNMPGYPLADYAGVTHSSCICENCERKFRAMYGQPLPKLDGFADPAWAEYLEFKQRTAADLARRTREVIDEIRPNAGIVGHEYGDQMFRWETQRRVSRPAPEWAYQSGEQSRFGKGINSARATASTSAAHIDYPWRQVTETAACHMLRFAQQLSAGSWLDLYLMGTLDDQDEPTYLQPLRELFQWFAVNSGSYHGLADASRIGLYVSESTRTWGAATPSGQSGVHAFRGMYSMMIESRLPFAFVCDSRVRNEGGDLKDRFDTIILPSVAILTDVEAAALDGFVEQGGLLIATGDSGGYDKYGTARGTMAMATSPVRRFGTTVNAHGWTFLGADFGIGGQLAVSGCYWPSELRPGTENWLPRAPLQPFGPPEFSFAERHAAGDQAWGVLVRRAGRGVSVHIPWQIDHFYYRDALHGHRHLLQAIIKRFASPQPVRVTGAGEVEVTVQSQSHTNRLLIHLINYSGQRNTRYDVPAEIHRLRLGVLGVRTTATALVAGKDVVAEAPADEQGYIWFDLPPLGYFEAISIDKV